MLRLYIYTFISSYTQKKKGKKIPLNNEEHKSPQKVVSSRICGWIPFLKINLKKSL